MRVENRIEYLTERRLLAHLPQVAKWPLRYWRAARSEWAIAGANARALRLLRDTGDPIRLEMGAGPRKPPCGWTTVDIRAGCDLRLDLLARLPFAEGEVEEIYSSHVLEYFAYADLMCVLREWRRILRPGGRLRLALPNARIFLEAYLTDRNFDGDYFCRYRPAFHYHTRIDYANYMAYMDAHRHMFDQDNLLALLRAAEFSDVRRRDFDPAIDIMERQFESIYALATK